MNYTLNQLAKLINRTPQTIRLHIAKGHLHAEKFKGAHGWRVPQAEAVRWAAQYFGVNLPAA